MQISALPKGKDGKDGKGKKGYKGKKGDSKAKDYKGKVERARC